MTKSKSDQISNKMVIKDWIRVGLSLTFYPLPVYLLICLIIYLMS